jgi:hypothetical protein
MRRAAPVLSIFSMLLSSPPLCAAEPATLQELQEAGRLELATSLSPRTEVVPGQRVELILTVATDRWFIGGTRIGIPEVPGLVIVQKDQFASNASENRAGQTWVVQHWTLEVYPQRAGRFTIPTVPVQMKVAAGAAARIEGKLAAPAVSFTVAVPEALAQADHWVAAPAFTVTGSVDRSLENLQVGDAFERQVLFEASDVLAMMLPTLREERRRGLAAYADPPSLEDRNDRGQVTARRRERIVYVVESPGHYLLPERDFFWWDTGSRELKLLTLPALEFTAGGAADDEQAGTGGPVPRRLLAGFAGLLTLAALLWLARKMVKKAPPGRLTGPLRRGWLWLAALRKPALPRQLNPGSSAGE